MLNTCTSSKQMILQKESPDHNNKDDNDKKITAVLGNAEEQKSILMIKGIRVVAPLPYFLPLDQIQSCTAGSSFSNQFNIRGGIDRVSDIF